MKYLVDLKHQKILLFVLSLFLLQTSAHTAEVVLQSIANLDNDDIHNAHDGNSFKLIQLDQGCKIEAQFYLSNQNRSYNYYFQNHLTKATEQINRYHYEKDFEGSLDHVTDVYPYASAKLNIQDHDVKQDFHLFKALFPNQDLKRCAS